MSFDPQQYKENTRRQWEGAAQAWHRWGPFIDEWLGEATEQMLDAAGVGTASQVLDVAAGAGGQSLVAARRAGPQGRVLVTDISPKILECAARSAEQAGLSTVETLELDGEHVGTLPPGSFDAVVCRLGVMFFPDRHGALVGMRGVLREGGRAAFVVYSTPERNPFFALPVGIIRARAQLPAPEPGQPGPFSLAGPGVLEGFLVGAGFRDVCVQSVSAPLRMSSAAECVRFEQESFGALHDMLSGVAEPDRPTVWGEVEQAFARFDGPSGFSGPCELLVGVGTR
jgi:SAM-dependent methyltransferase